MQTEITSKTKTLKMKNIQEGMRDRRHADVPTEDTHKDENNVAREFSNVLLRHSRGV